MRFFKNALVVALTVSFLATPVRALAQAPQALPPGAIERALAERSADVAAQRGAIYAALQQPEVQRVAERLGVDVSRAERAVATLGGVELNQMAAQAQLVNDAVAGGQTVRLNLLWIVIGLLILLVILVA